jgi:hypothetical protein
MLSFLFTFWLRGEAVFSGCGNIWYACFALFGTIIIENDSKVIANIEHA